MEKPDLLPQMTPMGADDVDSVWLKAGCPRAARPCSALIYINRNEKDRVSGDQFGDLLRDKDWWPQTDIAKLAREYNFAMQLLEQADLTK